MMTKHSTRAGLTLAKFGVGLGNVTSKLGQFAPAIGLGILAFKGLHDWWTSADRKKREEERKNILKGMKVRGEFAAPVVAKGMRHFDTLATQLAAFQKQRMEFEAKGLEPGSPAHTKAYRQANKEQFLQEVQLTEKLRGKAGEVSAMYKKIAESAAGQGLSADYMGEWTRKKMAAAAKNIARREGVAGQDFAVEQIRSALAQLDAMLATSTDATGDFAKMLKGEYLPAVLKTAMGTDLTADTPATAMSKELQDALRKAGKKGRSKVNVTINKIEVQTDDPDRFVFGMTEAFSDAAKNPSGISDAFGIPAREG